MTAILAVAGVTLFCSFLCSLLEGALLSISTAKLETLRAQGVRGLDRLVRLSTKNEEPFAAILTLDTMTHVVGPTVCGALIARNYGGVWVGIFTTLLTFAILLATGVLPRSLGVRYSAALAPFIGWPIQWLIWTLWPLVWLCRWIMNWVQSGVGGDRAPTEHEIIASSRVAAQSGELRPQEVRWLENVLRLDQVKAEDLMTPRTVVYRLPADLPLSAVQHRSQHWLHSRLPVTEDRNPDNLLGLVYRREVFDAIVFHKPAKTLRDLMHTIDFVPASMRGHQLLDKFITEKQHMAAVVDEYGAFLGVVTLEDVLECMLGSEIVDEHDRHADMQQFAREHAQERDLGLHAVRE